MPMNSNLGQIMPTMNIHFYKSEKIISATSQNISDLLNCLKRHINSQYRTLSCLSGVDFSYSKHRFNVVYELLGFTFFSRVRVKVFINEITAISSAAKTFVNSD